MEKGVYSLIKAEKISWFPSDEPVSSRSIENGDHDNKEDALEAGEPDDEPLEPVSGKLGNDDDEEQQHQKNDYFYASQGSRDHTHEDEVEEEEEEEEEEWIWPRIYLIDRLKNNILYITSWHKMLFQRSPLKLYGRYGR